MQYREFGKTGEKLSILGFGMMRFPTIKDGDKEKIDEEKAMKMVRNAIDKGVNYLDTAYVYHGGESESFTAKVMKDGYRAKVKVATKLPVWLAKTHEDLQKYLDEQIANLEVEKIDFFLLHSLGKESFANMQKCDYKSFMDKAKADKKIGYAGFSFHDDIDTFKKIVDDYDWDFCQIQLNYLDDNYQAGLEGMKYAAERGLGIIIMEPLRGGMLAKPVMPDEINKLFASSPAKMSPAAWALRYVWDFTEVGLVLSGMSTLEQVEDNLNTADIAKTNSLDSDQKDIIKGVKAYFKEHMPVDCTSCNYCMPCPFGVWIPDNFWAINHDMLFDDFGKGEYWANGFIPKGSRASDCTQCGVCLEKCPQHIEIPTELEKVAKRYKQV